MSIVLTLAYLFSANQAQAFSGYLQQLKPLFSNETVVSPILPDTPLSERIDQITLKIFSTPTGKSFCSATTEDFNAFKNAHFINQDFARQAFQICQGSFSNEGRQEIFEKKFFSITDSKVTLPFDAWTTPKNETYLVITPELTDDELSLVLIHELAISLDRKEQIGFFGIIDFPKVGLVSSPESCDTIHLIRSPRVKHVLSAARAFEMELQLAHELSLATNSFLESYKSMSCEQKLESVFKMTEFLYQVTQAENSLNQHMDTPSCNSKFTYKQKPLEALSALKSLNLSFADGSRRNACEYLSEGVPFLAGVSFRGGPRPRIGGGWVKGKKDPLSTQSTTAPALGDDFQKIQESQPVQKDLLKKSPKELEEDVQKMIEKIRTKKNSAEGTKNGVQPVF